MKKISRCIRMAMSVLVVALSLAAPAFAQESWCPSFLPKSPCTSYQPYCAPDCNNKPFCPNNCWTTEYGPARADIILGSQTTSPNMLYCDPATIAYCGGSGKPPLPCVLNADGTVADCTCDVVSSSPYFVIIGGILNLGAYYETVV